MITLITGAPGTGKTAAAVSLIQELSSDRAVYCNGIPDLAVSHQELEDPTKWPDDVPDGSIIVIDEAQRIWRPRGPGAKVPQDIAALETHRHRGLDFYVITQAPRLVDTNVRSLVGRHVHLRDLGILGRFWYEWPECAETCVSSWKSAPISKRYRLPKSAFSLYKSASIHIKPIRSVPWMLVVMVIALFVTLGLAWRSYVTVSAKFKPIDSPVDSSASKKLPSPSVPVNLPSVVQYDISQFVPRLSNRPESAPAYDGIRTVVSMPFVVGGICMRGICKCYDLQGSNSGLSSDECRLWIKNRPFNPYIDQKMQGHSVSSPLPPASVPARVVDHPLISLS